MGAPDDIVVLNDEQVRELLTPEDSFAALEQAYRQLAEGRAITRPRTRTYLGTGQRGADYQFVCMDGGSSEPGYFALRLLSALRRYPTAGGVVRAESVSAADGKRFGGLILVFDLADGMLAALMPQSSISVLRVAATSALAARHLARPDSRVLGVIGSGGQATGHAIALAQRYPLAQVRVFSPNPAHRRRFAQRVGAATGVEVLPLETAREAAACDILVTATNALAPTYEAEWIAPGTCVISINMNEVPDAMDQRAAVIAVKGKERTRSYAAGNVADNPEMATDEDAAWDQYPDLADLVVGRAEGRTAAEQITLFRNNAGLGLEFAATGGRAYELARQRCIGHRIPRDWFMV